MQLTYHTVDNCKSIIQILPTTFLEVSGELLTDLKKKKNFTEASQIFYTAPFRNDVQSIFKRKSCKFVEIHWAGLNDCSCFFLYYGFLMVYWLWI
jgi:hypothetical protein